MLSNETPFLDAVLRATDETSSRAAYNAVLSGVGNDHQATLFAEAEDAVEPFLAVEGLGDRAIEGESANPRSKGEAARLRYQASASGTEAVPSPVVSELPAR